MKKVKMMYTVIGFCVMLFSVLPAHADLMDFSYFHYNSGMGPQMLSYAESRGFCGLTRISGKFEGYDSVSLNIDHDPITNADYWAVETYGSSHDINVDIECIDYYHFSNRYIHNALKHFWWYPASRFFNRNDRIFQLWGNDSICYLYGVGGRFEGSGEFAWILAHESTDKTPDPGSNWLKVVSNTDEDVVFGHAMCVAIQPGRYQPVTVHEIKQGEPDLRMIRANEGVCFMSGMSGKFEGGGEEIGIYVDDQGWRTLYVRSQQVDVRAKATCIRYSD
jgi:hypothetical protein